MKIYKKNIYNLDNNIKASSWIREEVKGLKTFDAPQISSACTIKPKGYGTIVKGALGYMPNNANNIYYNGTMVNLLSSCFSAAHGLSTIPENFYKCVSLFTARDIKNTWVRHHDEYKKPNENL